MKRLLVRLAGVLAVSLVAATGAAAQASPAGTTPSAGTESSTDRDLPAKVEGIDAQVQVIQGDLDKLKKIKVTGYIQTRYEFNQQSSVPPSLDTKASPIAIKNPNLNRFHIRRGRLKVTYDSSPLSQAVIYFDGNTSGSDRNVRLLEAYVTLRDLWTPEHRHALNAGQMNVPFGYEIERSSSVRELLERSKAENVLFPGERDRGVTLTSQWIPQLQTVIGLFNGPGINSTDYPTTPPRKGRDFVARARWSQGIFDVAGSAYVGKNMVLIDTTAASLRKVQIDRTRYGADAQCYYQLSSLSGLPLGGGSLKFEFYTGKDFNTAAFDATKRKLKAGRAINDLASDFIGWYGMVVQNFGEALQFAARYDYWDPNTKTDTDAVEHDQYRRIGVALNWFYDANTRLTVAWDNPRTETKVGSVYADPQDNAWIFQLQHKF